VIGSGEKRVGFWTPNKGLAKILDRKGLMSKNSTYSSSKNDLGSIIWPGDMHSIPPIWKKLKIGVPARHADNYPEFLRVTYNHSTNKTKATGLSIAVFRAAVDILPYNLKYEFFQYAKSDGEMAGTYDELITELYYGVGTPFLIYIFKNPLILNSFFAYKKKPSYICKVLKNLKAFDILLRRIKIKNLCIWLCVCLDMFIF
jgi:hypothetical protein